MVAFRNDIFGGVCPFLLHMFHLRGLHNTPDPGFVSWYELRCASALTHTASVDFFEIPAR